MPTESADDNGQLNKEQVALALQNVSHIFGDEAVDSGSTQEADSKFSRMHSGRNRVDSAARPPQFMQNNNAKKGAACFVPPSFALQNAVPTCCHHIGTSSGRRAYVFVVSDRHPPLLFSLAHVCA